MEIPVAEERIRYEIKIVFDVVTGVVSISGCDGNPLVALGMLDYALGRVRRVITTNDIIQESQKSPLLFSPRGTLS